MGGNYFGRHWRGELSLARSYWLNHLLLGALSGAVVGLGVGMLTRAFCEQPILDLYLTASLVLLWIYVRTWDVVGTWRAAASSRRDHGRAGRAFVVQGLLVLSVISSGVAVIGFVNPSLQAVRHDAPVPIAGTAVRAHGRRLDFYGPVGLHAASTFRQALAAAPAARLVRLESNGGSVAQARMITEMIRAAGLDTEVTRDCVSACTIMFFGGKHRWLREGARLGFHSYSSAAMTPQDIVHDEEFERRTYAASGISSAFIERIFSVPPARVWYPTRDEAETAGFATRDFATSEDPAPTSPP